MNASHVRNGSEADIDGLSSGSTANAIYEYAP